MLDNDLSVSLDASHLCALLGQWERSSALIEGAVVDRGLFEAYDEAWKRFRAQMEEYRALALQTSILSATPLATHVAASQKYPFIHAKDDGADSGLGSGGGNAWAEDKQTIVNLAQTLFPEGTITVLEDVIDRIETIKTTIIDQEMAFFAAHSRLLVDMAKTGRDISVLERAFRAIHAQTQPIAEEYLTAFSNYMMAVFESLHLKLQIVEAETGRVCYPPRRPEELTEEGSKASKTLLELDEALRVGQTNLLLFQQLGPAVGKIAIQYQQILSQITLLTDDISELSRR